MCHDIYCCPLYIWLVGMTEHTHTYESKEHRITRLSFEPLTIRVKIGMVKKSRKATLPTGTRLSYTEFVKEPKIDGFCILIRIFRIGRSGIVLAQPLGFYYRYVQT
jgi:hypothetical protein